MNLVIQDKKAQTIQLRSVTGTIPWPTEFKIFKEFADHVIENKNYIAWNILSIVYMSDPYRK